MECGSGALGPDSWRVNRFTLHGPQAVCLSAFGCQRSGPRGARLTGKGEEQRVRGAGIETEAGGQRLSLQLSWSRMDTGGASIVFASERQEACGRMEKQQRIDRSGAWVPL